MTCEYHIKGNDFLESNWEDLCQQSLYYSDLASLLSKLSQEQLEQGNEAKHQSLKLVADICNLKFQPSSTNNTYSPRFQLMNGNSSLSIDVLDEHQLAFLLEIVEQLDNQLLKARIADILWIRLRKIQYAHLAINAYSKLAVDCENFCTDIKNAKERGTRLALQIKSMNADSFIEQLLTLLIKANKLQDATLLSISDLILKLGTEFNNIDQIARLLSDKGNSLKADGNYLLAREYYQLSGKAYFQLDIEEEKIRQWFNLAECFELEAKSRLENMTANSFYEDALQAYRKIPSSYRKTYSIDNKLTEIRFKIEETGKARLEEMATFSTDPIDVSEAAASAEKHVRDKGTFDEALLYYSGLPPLCLKEINEEQTKREPFLADLIGNASFVASDGRTVAKSSYKEDKQSKDIPSNIMNDLPILIKFKTVGGIIPALHQLLMEFRFTPEMLEAICLHSSIVPDKREKTVAHGLWLGFEYRFSSAIHVLAPQLENIVRIELKNKGIHTTTIDTKGIETENGLSTLIAMEPAKEIIGPNNCFNIQALFTDPKGPNLRNEVAHGLIDDDSSNSHQSIYAWWFILRLIIQSLIKAQPE